MSMLGIDGFDNYHNPTDMISQKATPTRAFQWTSASSFLSIQPGTNFFDYGQCISGGEVAYAVATLTNPITTGIWGGHVFIPENSFLWVTAFDSSAPQYVNGSSQVGILLNSYNASLSAYRDLALASSHNLYEGILSPSSVLLGRSSNNLYPVNSCFLLEISFTIGSSGGALSVAINGTSVLNLTGLNTQTSGDANFDSWGWGLGAPAGPAIQLDNFYFLDSSIQSLGANPFNSFQSAYGLTRVFSSFPTADSGSPEFTPLTGSNYQEVDETSMDGDTTYNYSDTSGNKDLFTITPLPAGLNPLYCQVKMAGRQTSAGSLAMATVLKSGATELDGESIISYQTYTYQGDGSPVDPATGIAWTNAGVSACLIGYTETA
jgi:hypothetical protein